jgi:type II secretory pathway pseudopilin PulG
VEVLVVIGMIAILVSMLMPALRKARATGEQVKCASNLRQLGMALQMYANANRGWMPNWSGWHTYPDGQSSEDAPGLGWTEVLQPWFVRPDDPAYNCPSFPGDEPRRNYFLAAQWAGRSGRHAMKFTDVTMSSRFVLSGDTTQTSLYAPPFGSNRNENDDCDRDDFGGQDRGRVLAWPWDQGGFWMHRGGNNVLFDDLHVSLFDRFDASRLTFHPKQMQDWPDVTAGE